MTITDRRGITVDDDSPALQGDFHAGLAIKTPVPAATTANITLSGEQTIDGVALTTGDRVLVKDQTNAVDNGIWIVSTGTWSRAVDMNGAGEIANGTRVIVTHGTVNEATEYYVSTDDPITIGTSNIAWSQLSSGGGGVSNGDKGDITVSGGGSTWTIDAGAVSYAKIQNVSVTARLMGRITAGAGSMEELTGTQATTLLDAFTPALKGLAPASGGGTTNFLRADGTWTAPTATVSDGDKGDITVSGSGAVWTIDNTAVSYAKIQNVSATSRILGRVSGGAGVIEELTGTQATTFLDPFTSGLQGVAPASGGGTTNFLRADGSWAVPPGTGALPDGDKGDITVSGSGTIWTIDAGVVTLAKMANIATDRLIGRDTAATGVPEALTVSGGIEFTGSGGIQTSAFTGDVTKSAGGTATTIANDAVTYAKMQNISATARFLGRITAGAGDTEELTGTQATTLLDEFTDLLKGLAPASGGGTTNFLRADGTWTSPSAVVADGDKGDITVSASGATWTIDNDVVTYAKMQNVSATSRVLGRKTAAAGDTEECTLSEVLDFVGSAAQGDILYRGAATWTRLGAGTSGNFLKTQGAGANPVWASAGVGTPTIPQGRLTLATATPVMTTTQSAKTTIYYTPYYGQHVPIYDGSSYTMTDTGGELSQATTDSTKSPAACTTNSNYDLFVWDDGGTIRCTRGPAWSSDTARGTGAGTTELTRVSGFWLNANNITNGPAAQRGTYVGTVRTNGSSQVDWIFGALAAGGTAGVLGVWNLYNRELVATTVRDSTDSWSYTTASWRASNNSSTMRVSFVVGLDLSAIDAAFTGEFSVASSGGTAAVGVGLDSTTAFTGTTGVAYNAGANLLICGAQGRCNVYPGIGYHYVSAIENGATGTVFAGDDANPTKEQTGLDFKFKM